MKFANRNPRRGFVLLMTLFVLAIVGLLLISLANHSMVAATDALSLRKETEQKWAQASCQRYVLNHVDEFLSEEGNEGEKFPIKEYGFTVSLQDSSYEVLVEDESAKLSVNLMFEHLSREETTQAIRQALPSKSGLIVDLRPNPSDNSDAINDHFEGWGQVFNVPAKDTRNSNLRLASASKKLTCWSPRVNIRTADEQVLLESIKCVVGASIANQLVDARDANPQTTVSELINTTGATESQAQSLSRILADRSWCQSIRIRTERSGYNRTTQLFRKFYTASVFRIQSYRW